MCARLRAINFNILSNIPPHDCICIQFFQRFLYYFQIEDIIELYLYICKLLPKIFCTCASTIYCVAGVHAEYSIRMLMIRLRLIVLVVNYC